MLRLGALGGATRRGAPIKSPYGRRLAEAFGIDPEDADTNAVILDGLALVRSDAALAVISALPGWRWTPVLGFVPRKVRDGLYTFVARRRHRLFGRRTVCYYGDAAFADRIITEAPLISAGADERRHER